MASEALILSAYGPACGPAEGNERPACRLLSAEMQSWCSELSRELHLLYVTTGAVTGASGS